jgi:hypothetical protein
MNKEKLYWLSHIKNEFAQNFNLYSEYEMLSDNTNISNAHFQDGHILQNISKLLLLEYIDEFISKYFNNRQYFVTTNKKPDKRKYYIVVSLIKIH